MALHSLPGDAILVYLSSSAAVSVRLDKIAASGPAQATWIDVRTGTRTQAGTFPNKGTASFSLPSGWEDALLLLRPADR